MKLTERQRETIWGAVYATAVTGDMTHEQFLACVEATLDPDCRGTGITQSVETLPKRWRDRATGCSADAMDAFNWAADELEALIEQNA
jgi:hypothetical protein